DRGLNPALAREVAEQLMAHDALGAHARDEIGISEQVRARPLQAAASSGATFTAGAALPLLAAALVPELWLAPAVAASSLAALAALGAVAARAGGASMARGAARVTFWGTAAMTLTAGVGRLFGVAV
ncbi:MAG: VIT1/CCC1 transporter family protein, partial [Gammaproteobacteria bacterium]